MKKINRDFIPAGFRHLLSMRDIKAIQQQASMEFISISFSNHLDTARFMKDNPRQSHVKPLTLSGYERDGEWQLRIHQSAFRDELLPLELESQAKDSVLAAVVDYINRLRQSRDTDFIYSPQLWVTLEVRNNQVQVRTKELN